MRHMRDDLPMLADINVTSLVDVAFTLLVIFIITAPVLQGGIEVDVPEADVDPVTASDEWFIVSVDRSGRIFVEETEFEIGEFRSSLQQLVDVARPERIYIKGDSLATWGRMEQVIGVVKNTGTDFVMIGRQWEEG